MKARALVALSLVLPACDSAPGTLPDEMSAPSHQEESAGHERAGAAHAAEAQESSPGSWSRVPGAPRVEADASLEEHRELERWHDSHARQHAAAARVLTENEQQECSGLSQRQREQCPLSEWIGKLEKTPSGVAVRLYEAGKRDEVLRRMRCHHAFGRKLGYPRMPSCPLYLPFTTIQAASDGSLAIETLDPARTPASTIWSSVPVQTDSAAARDAPRSLDVASFGSETK